MANIIELLVQSTGLTKEKLEKLYGTMLERAKLQGLPEADRPLHAVRSLQAFVKRQQAGGESENVRLFLYGWGGAVDGVLKRRTAAMQAFQKNPDASIIDGLIIRVVHQPPDIWMVNGRQVDVGQLKQFWLEPQNDGTVKVPDFFVKIQDSSNLKEWIAPLDARKTNSGGGDNRGFGKPLPLHSWFGTATGYVLREGETAPQKLILSMNDNMVTPLLQLEVPMYKEIATQVYLKNEENGVLNMGTVKTTMFEPEEHPVAFPDIAEFMKSKTMTFAEVRALVAKRNPGKIDPSKFNQDFVLIEGMVYVIPEGTLDPTRTKGRLIRLSDAKVPTSMDSCLAWLPPHVKIDFGRDSHVIISGKTSPTMDDKEFQLGADGLMVVVNTKGQELNEDDIKNILADLGS